MQVGKKVSMEVRVDRVTGGMDGYAGKGIASYASGGTDGVG